jgi:hypothetical protein
MASLENNRRQDYRPVGAFTALTHSLTPSHVPNVPSGQQLEHNHSLRCDAFCVEYITQSAANSEKLKNISIIPAGLAGLPQGRYTLSPEPNAEISSKIVKRLHQAHTSGDIGVVLLRDLLSLESEFPAYSWKPSQSIHAGTQESIESVTPLLPEFKEFVAHPSWMPHFGMKCKGFDRTDWVSATLNSDTISCLFRSSSESTEGETPSVLSLKLKYSGPSLAPDEHPSVIGERVTSGLKELMERAQIAGAVETHDALLAGEFKPAFLEPIINPSHALQEVLQRPILKPQQHTLSSGAITTLQVDPQLGLAVVKLRAHGKEGASTLTCHMPVQLRPTADVWIADVSEAYRLLTAPGESMRLSGLYALRSLSASMDYSVTNVATLLGQEDFNKLLAVAADWKMVVGCETGPNISIANMLALSDGIQQVGFMLAREKRPSTIYTELLVGFALDGSICFSAKNDIGGAFEGRLHQSVIKVTGDRSKAAQFLVEAFGKQQNLKERGAFEQIAQTLVELDNSGYSYALSQDNPSFCSVPPKHDNEGQRAYELGGAVVRSFSAAAKIPVRASVHYLGSGACETLVSYPGAPFEMRFVMRGNTLSEVRFSAALPLHTDPIKREEPSLQMQTNLNVLDQGHGTEAAGTLLLNYLKYARESMDPRSAKPLIESDLWRVVRSLATPSLH